MITIQQEIVLYINNFPQQQWFEETIPETGKQPSQTEQPESAHWNAWLEELPFEIEEQSGHDKKLYLMRIRQGKSSIHIQVGESTVQLDGHYSIDPYNFLTNQLTYN
jgi:hypothetical protein